MRRNPRKKIGGDILASNEELLHAASQIHQGPAQYLATALLSQRLCERFLLEDPSKALALLRRSRRITQAALDSVRATIHMLRRPPEATASIAHSLQATIECLEPLSEAVFCLNVDEVGLLPRAVEAGLANVGSEALTNAAKHAEARHIILNLHMSRGSIILLVQDDGKGFDYAKILSRHAVREGVGLVLMRDQIQRLGGTLGIKSYPAWGTLVKAAVPLTRRSATITRQNAQPPRVA